MAKEIIIYGKETCPFTNRAREAKNQEGYTVIYRDVLKDDQNLQEMLKLTGGDRRVPVLVEADMVSIGYGGT